MPFYIIMNPCTYFKIGVTDEIKREYEDQSENLEIRLYCAFGQYVMVT